LQVTGTNHGQKDGWSAGDVGAERTWRSMAAAAGQESASLQLRERCRAQCPLRSARWTSCEGAEVLARSVGSCRLAFDWTGGIRLHATAFPGERAGETPAHTASADPCSGFLQRRTVGQPRGSLIRAIGVRPFSDSRGNRALASAQARAIPACSASGAQ